MKATIADSGGYVEVRINGTTEITYTGDTRNGGNASSDRITFCGVNNLGIDWWFDDVYMLNGSGSTNNDFLGDVRVAALLPSGAGASTQWTPLSGANYTNVDDATPDDDTTYNSDATAGDKDTFALPSLPSTAATVYGVQTLTWDRKDDAGSRTLRHVVRESSTDYESADLTVLDAYTYHRAVWETNPNSGSAWTDADIDCPRNRL